ncbi:hypothetical protein Nit79A3_0987 [Nitrosomonas sp. Is79A3]|uniref:N-acyl amino acid synthase FeeM domain-containing protein n=1 Tax=Nitrosomonas sp. (strain Is79A3) TaxID=261292 RepID=UPI000215D4A1
MEIETNACKYPAENLSFSLRIVKSLDDLKKAAELRQKAYARHVPEFAKQLSILESADTDLDTFVLLVESKNDGSPLGTMRIHVNRYTPLPLESSIKLPEQLKKLSLAEAVRFGIIEGANGKQARDALFKAFYLVCLALKVDRMLVCARFPLHKLYLSLLFEDVFPSGEYIKLKHTGNIPHRVLSLNLHDVESRWRSNQHPLYEYVFQTDHPNINCFVDQI